MSVDARALTPFREALGHLSAAAQVLRHRQMPEMQGSTRAVAQLGAAGTPPRPPDASALDKARQSILAAAPTGTFERVPARDMREAVWLLWAPEQPLAMLPGLLNKVVEHADRQMSARRKLIQAWLLGFAVDAPSIEGVGRNIRGLFAKHSDARLDDWRAADRDFALFDARTGPHRVATAVLMSPRSVETVLQNAGLDDPMQAGGGYARAVQTEVLTQFAANPLRSAIDPILDRCLKFLSPKDVLRFDEPEARGGVARGLLAPWLRAGPHPPDEIRAGVQAFLLRHLKDPRLPNSHWSAVGNDAAKLMQSWLNLLSFQVFFDLIQEYSSDKQFVYRRAFWSAYLERGLIDEVWLVLGNQIHDTARTIKALNGSYGRLSGSTDVNSVLLMRVRDVILCEWSNVGALRAWKIGSRDAPKMRCDCASLHKQCHCYPSHGLKVGSLSFPKASGVAARVSRPENTGAPEGQGLWHRSPIQGRWQSSAATFMTARTGVALSPNDWMPR